jgi:hypothetical protein
MPDYQKAKIYKLWSPQATEDEIYIGSTCDKLYKRKNGHKRHNDCRSKILFEKYDDVRIELIEEYPCNNRAELEKREGEYIRGNKCLNKQIPNRTIKEWREDNKESIKEYTKEYRENNKEKAQEYNKEWRENNKEKKAETDKNYYKNNKEKIKEKQKEYNNNNKEKIREKQKEYNNNNKEHLNNYYSQKVTCDCGCIFRKDGLIRHQKSSKHIKLMEEKIN